ncbi:bifunctional lytic transglycosylase/C40 family peptidase [Fictibacillus enclensis]|uniref:bifunctional lytic transglycosylase/C40 family peptidase n=1 Tax=Fictibacillus enclensis TaxID=1017270 RepID=UPI0025A143EA|nr:bifunctional lytic transglycosylase/C40 family peptidase [Fictibacillus enclensis]MDM5335778.1 bifunctional lytic transglycosylase/C40 family peptidase [Fictibacillus enclensis]
METNNAFQGVQQTVKKIKMVKVILGLLKLKTLWIALLVALILFVIVMAIGLFGGRSYDQGSLDNVTMLNLSETTMQWLGDVQKECDLQEVPGLVPYVMAIIEVETRGEGNDVMQSSESAGMGPNGFSNPLDSIKQGVKYLKNVKTLADSLGVTDYLGIVQSYNFGSNYVSFLATHHQSHSVDIAEKYSRTVVAPSLGNSSGQTYSYVNAVSQSYGKTYLYRNGGNYFYADLIKQYVSAGSAEVPVGSEVFKTVMSETLKYQGWSYSWGGSTPNTGFDCSGLMQWAYKKAGISLPRVAMDQWKVTKEIPIKEAEPGDLIFFKGTYGGPNHISHVGIYVDETRMYDSNGSGIGYHYWTSSYWISHFDSIRRIVH